MNTPALLGVLPDPRNPQEKEFDITHEEIFTSSVSTPTYLGSKTQASQWVGQFPVDDQQQTSSCVAHGKVLALSIFMYFSGITKGVFVQLSSMFVYRNRSNYPGAGMIPSSADTQVEQQGAPQYADLPTPATEAEANALVINPAETQAAKGFSGIRWVQLIDPTDVNTMAFVANNQNLPLNILIYATIAEWSEAVVEVLTPGLVQGSPEAAVSHCVTILPNSAYLEPSNGKYYVMIQDSADFGGIFFRAVSEDFIKARTYECAYPISVDNTPVLTKPKINLTADLSVGSTGPDVVALQEALQYLGYLPNIVNGQPFAPTGTYAGMTKTAVLQLQNEYASEILTPSGLMEGTGYCGSSTRAFLNSQFS